MTVSTHAEAISIHALREEGDRVSGLVGASPTYFYPRPPRGGRPAGKTAVASKSEISIHALREEGDRLRQRPMDYLSTYFYPRPPRGGRQKPQIVAVELMEFLSTPSARRATNNDDGSPLLDQISIHALREEGDEQR